MQPNEQPLPPNYLDQIAPKPASKLDFFKKKPVIIGAIALGAILIILIIASLSSVFSASKVQSEKLYERLVATQKITTSASNNLKSSNLKATNSQLNLDLTNMVRDLGTILTDQKIDPKGISKNITNSESSASTLSTLEDARLNDDYDQVYIREMNYQLQNVLALMSQLDKSSNNQKLKTFISSSYSDLTTIQKSLENFND